MYLTSGPRQFLLPALVPVLAALLLAACSGGHPRPTPATTAATAATNASATRASGTPPSEAAATPRPTPSPSLTASLRPGVAPIGRATPARGSSGPLAQASGTPSQPLTPAQLLRRDAVPTIQECIDAGIGPCYTPADIAGAYDIASLHDAGIDGSGQGVVIVVSFGSETLAADVAAYSRAMGLPDA